LTETAQIKYTFRQNLFYFFPILFCFLLPFGSILDRQLLSGVIVLWGLSCFLNLNAEDLRRGLRNQNFWLMIIFFVLTCVSAAASHNSREGATSIESKLGFLFVPYFFFCFKWTVPVLKRCMVSFVSGCLFAALFLIARAFYFYLHGQPEYFFYTAFSYFIHASYFSMYLQLAVSIVFIYYPIWFSQNKQLIRTSSFFMIIFIITIFLCASKMGLITFFLLVPLLLIYRSRKLFSVKRSLILFGALILVAFAAVKFLPGAFERLQSITSFSYNNIDKTTSESTAVRVLIWEQCLNIIRSHFLLGVGVGDANDALYQAYEKNSLIGALSHHFNAHNQFFQTMIGMGIVGLISLLAITFWQFVKAVMKKHFLLFVFSMLITFNFLVESMLQTSAGNLFFVFFFCLFNLPNIKNELQK
jgi:O-antigen ligase